MTDFDARAISTIRGLAMDAPHAARSGHQGTAMDLQFLFLFFFCFISTFFFGLSVQHNKWFICFFFWNVCYHYFFV